MLLFFKQIFESPANLSSKEEYLAAVLKELKSALECPTMPPLGEGKSFQYLEGFKGYLEVNGAELCPEDALVSVVKAAKDSIDHEDCKKDEVFEILSYYISSFNRQDGKCRGQGESKNILAYQDVEGMTALHHLITFGDEWCPVVKDLFEKRHELTEISNKEGKYPLGLAAEVGACGIFLVIALEEYSKEALLQCIKPIAREEFQNSTASDISAFAKEPGDPNKVEIPLIIYNNPAWKKAYNNLRIFGTVTTDKLLEVFEKEPKGFPDEQITDGKIKDALDGKIKDALEEIMAKVSIEDLKEERGPAGDTMLHIAYLNKASIAAIAILRKFAAQEPNDPAKGIQEALSMKNKWGKTPLTVGFLSKVLHETIQKEIPQIIQHFSLPANPLKP